MRCNYSHFLNHTRCLLFCFRRVHIVCAHFGCETSRKPEVYVQQKPPYSEMNKHTCMRVSNYEYVGLCLLFIEILNRWKNKLRHIIIRSVYLIHPHSKEIEEEPWMKNITNNHCHNICVLVFRHMQTARSPTN